MVAGLSDEANVSSLIKERAVMYYLVVMGTVAAFYSATPLPFHIHKKIAFLLVSYQLLYSWIYL